MVRSVVVVILSEGGRYVVRGADEGSERTFRLLNEAFEHATALDDTIVLFRGLYIFDNCKEDPQLGIPGGYFFDRPVTLLGVGNPVISIKSDCWHVILGLKRGGGVWGITVDGASEPRDRGGGTGILSLGSAIIKDVVVRNIKREAIAVRDASNVVIDGVRTSNSWTGVLFLRSAEVSIFNSIIENTRGDGIYFWGVKRGRAVGNTLIDIGDTGIDSVAIGAPNEHITITGNELYNARIGFSGTRHIHIASNKLVGESWIYMGYFAGENDFVIISNNFIDTVHKYAMYLEGEHIVVNGNVIIHRKPNAMSFYLSIGNIEIINNFVFFPSVFIKLRYSSEGLLNVCCNSIYAVPGERLVFTIATENEDPLS